MMQDPRPATAAEVVDRTFRRTGVLIRELDTPDATARGADLLRAVWGSGETIAPPNLIRAVQQTGGYVFGIYDASGLLLAVSVGLLANEGLHSHITGVLPARQGHGLGLALKQHQRAWALDRGITTISWTSDPLVRRNVAFNLHALGARVVDYLPDHYGPLNDAVNQGDASDRFSLHWDLLSPQAIAAEEKRIPWLSSEAPLAVGEGPTVHKVPGPDRRVQLPADIEAIRRTDPQRAREWRYAVRDAVLAGLFAGATVTGLTADGALVLEVLS